MAENVVQDYGWSSTEGPHTCDFLAPEILQILKNLPVRRVMDLGCGNGALCASLSASREALGNKAVKRPLRPELFQMDVLGAN